MAKEGEVTQQARVTIDGRDWLLNGQRTYPGSPALGLLMNVRMVNCVFEDRGPGAGKMATLACGGDARGSSKPSLPGAGLYRPAEPGAEPCARLLPGAGEHEAPLTDVRGSLRGVLPGAGFEPEGNTRAFVAGIPQYVAAGVRAFTVSLQGGWPGYEGAENSAFAADGTLRESYLRRVRAVIDACDAHGAVVILSCFYQRQAAALQGRKAITAAVENTARWIGAQGLSNVVLEVANEYAHGGYRAWRDGDWLVTAGAQVELIERARAAGRGLLVSTSGMGDGRMDQAIAGASDFVLIHLNNTALADYAARIAAARATGKPVVCNEDDKLGSAGAAAARLCVAGGASWGFMHAKKNQCVPFAYDGSEDDAEVYAEVRRLTLAGAKIDEEGERKAIRQVLLTRPSDGATFAVGQAVAIEAAATGGVARVEFFAEGRAIGLCQAEPWRVEWLAGEPGRYDLWARATMADGQVVVSRAVDIVVVTR
ncbi:MAG: hypothetical protein IT443_01655 [Phycisphaeraceae bacterium]|nr:hypothetical protein [Phycisphaeraceae bacterium]